MAVADYDGDRYPDLAAYRHQGDGVYATEARLGGEHGLDRKLDSGNRRYVVVAEETDDPTPSAMHRADLTAFHPPCADEGSRRSPHGRRDPSGRHGVFGFVTPDATGYAHLIAVRDDARGTGLGRRLYAAFEQAARRQGARRLKAITSVGNTGSVAFHRSLGFEARIVEDYDGPGRTMVVFERPLPAAS